LKNIEEMATSHHFTTLSKVLKQKAGRKLILNCKIVAQKSTSAFVIADETDSMDLTLTEMKPSQARYFVVDRFIKIMSPIIQKSERVIVISGETAVFQGRSFEGAITPIVNGPVELTLADFALLSSISEVGPYVVSQF
jgi:hypothetical protein